MHPNQIDVVLLAAGKGKRMLTGKNKVFLPLINAPIIFHTLTVLDSIEEIGRIFLVLREDEEEILEQIFKNYGQIRKLARIVHGGKERHDSVMNGLNSTIEAGGSQWVMVHDGARPLITRKLISRMLKRSADKGIVVPALPIFETVRRMDNESKTKKIDRKGLFTIQTPQLFHSSAIKRVFMRSHGKIDGQTDEASYFEYQDEPVILVDGESWNIKITEQDDLDWARTLVMGRDELQLNRKLEKL